MKMKRWGKRRRMVRNTWVPRSRIIMGQPQSKPLNSVRKSFSQVISLGVRGEKLEVRDYL